MARPSDREYQLQRQIKDLKQVVEKLELENKRLQKIIDKTDEPKVYSKKAKVIVKPCPACGAEIKSTELPHGYMELCSAGCGHRNVRNK